MAICSGFVVGMGVPTRIAFGSLSVVMVACFGSASIAAGLWMMGIRAAAGAITLAMVAFAPRLGTQSPQRMIALSRLKPLITSLEGIALALTAGFVASQLLRTCD
jgi:hypothetical protein